MNLRWPRAAAPALIAAMLLTGCPDRRDGLDEVPPPQPEVVPETPRAGGEDPAVVIGPRDFEPRALRVVAGQTVTWRNEGGTTHSATSDARLAQDERNVMVPPHAEPFHSGALAPGAVFSHTFEIPGEYRYVCLLHEHEGMVGRVIVE